MKIISKRSCIVQPSEPTFNGYLPLSILDQVDCIVHIPIIYFYRHIDPQMLNDIVNNIKTSLSKVLVHFYPFAGRIHYIAGGGGGGNRIALDCNGKGAEFIEAKCDGKLEELGDNFTPSSHFYHLFPCIDYKKTSLEELSLLYVQLTRFQCGGLALSLTMSHVVVDGLSAAHFTSQWGRIARGAPLGVQPFHDRKLKLLIHNYHKKFLHEEYKSPPLLIGQSSNENERKKPTKTAILKLTNHQIEALKNKANALLAPTAGGGGQRRPYSRYEVIAAHVWRCTCKARRLANEQRTQLKICVDIRRHMDPPLPLHYLGNAAIDVCASAFCEELLSNSLTYVANIIREAILQVTSEYVNSAINFLENQKDLSKFQDLHALKNDKGPFYGNPNLQVVSWLSLPFHELDLGWGKSICMRPGTLDGDGDCILLPSLEKEGSAIISLCLQDQHMENFIKLFYQNNVKRSYI